MRFNARSIPIVAFMRRLEETQSNPHISNEFSMTSCPTARPASGGIVRFRTMRSVRTCGIRLCALESEIELDGTADDIVPINCAHPTIAYPSSRVNTTTGKHFATSIR